MILNFLKITKCYKEVNDTQTLSLVLLGQYAIEGKEEKNMEQLIPPYCHGGSVPKSAARGHPWFSVGVLVG
jgi:hypothetical protein